MKLIDVNELKKNIENAFGNKGVNDMIIKSIFEIIDNTKYVEMKEK